MKKILLITLVGLMAIGNNAMAQTGVRVTLEESQLDLRPQLVSDEHVVVDMQNPNGSEHMKMDIQTDGDEEISMTITDVDTGKVYGQVKGSRDKGIHAVSDIPGLEYDLQIPITEDPATVKAKIKHTNEDKEIEASDGKVNLFIDRKRGLHFSRQQDGSMRMEVRNPETQELRYVAQGSDTYGKVYDAQGKLIAEGPMNDDVDDDDDSNWKIYDNAEYQKYKKLADDDDDEEDDGEIPFSLELI